MDLPVLVLVISFVILLVLNVPVAFCMGISTVLAFLAMPGDLPAFVAVAHKIATGIDSFALLAIPFFILSGQLMGHGGIAQRLIDFANTLVGRFRGGLAFVNVVTCMFFGAISGSATAAISSVGGFMIPLMNKRGYPRDFNAAVTITAATTGLLIPPSNVMIVYSLATGGAVSIAAIFMAGFLPGFLVGLGLIFVAAIISVRHNYGEGEVDETVSTIKYYLTLFLFVALMVIIVRGFLGLLLVAWPAVRHDAVPRDRLTYTLIVPLVIALLCLYPAWILWRRFLWCRHVTTSFLRAVPALLLVFIVIGGILLGWFTPTEASAVAVLYAFILAVVVYREVKIRDLPKILLQCGITTSVVFLLIGTSMAMSWVLASENVPQDISAYLVGLTNSKVALLLLINAILLVVGTFMDMTPAILIFTPIFLPIAERLGLHPLHFGIIMIMNLCIGLCTPPVGTCLFLGCGIAETTVTKVMRHIFPFFGAMVASLLICTFIPKISMAIPTLFGFVR